MSRPQQDVAVIGGGVVGTSTAMAVAKTGLSVVVIEAEDRLAAHQSGHNTGIIHSGIYYVPGSRKARFCVEGRHALYRFCEEHGLRHERCGKVIIAKRQEELSTLDELERRASANGLVGVRRLTSEQIREHEPHAAGIAALFVPESGIVDYAEVTETYARLVREAGGEVRTGTRLLGCYREDGGFRLETTRGEVNCRFLINCAGLQSDRVARLCGVNPRVQVVPFRGQFYELVPDRRNLVQNLIYPVPDLRVPFLGMHLTRTVHGQVNADPNGALAFDRQGYRLGSVSLRDLGQMATYSGFWLMVLKHLKTGLIEAQRALSKRSYARPLQELIPDLKPGDLVKSTAGIHAEAVRPDGVLVDDFMIVEAERMVHILNATSPAATASLAIGTHVAALVARQLNVSVPLPETMLERPGSS